MLTTRPARDDDHHAFARLFTELRVPDPVPDAAAFHERLRPTTLIAEDGAEEGGDVVGYLFYELLDGVLYVRNVVSDPARRRMGVGRRLLLDAAALGRARGASTWCLNVKDDNVAAIRLYESLGMRVTSATHVIRLTWSMVSRLHGPPARLRVAPLEADDDAPIEQATGMPRGLLASRRAQHFELFAARAGDEVVGVSAFNPGFPGAFPFRARDEETARALLEAMARRRRLLADAEPWRRDGVQVVLEDNEPLADVLVARGGERVFRLLFLKGTIPAATGS